MKTSYYVLIGVLFISTMWRVGRFTCLGGCYLVYSVVVVSGWVVVRAGRVSCGRLMVGKFVTLFFGLIVLPTLMFLGFLVFKRLP